MSGKRIDDRMMLGKVSDLFGDLLETPAGLIVPARSAEPLIKSEAKRMAAAEQQDKPFLFSRYSLFQNMIYHGARAKPAGTPAFSDLYGAAKASFIDAILIRARINQAKMVWQKAVSGKNVGFKVVHEQHDDPKFKPTEDVMRRCKEMEDFLCNPTPKEYKNYYPHGVIIHEGGIKDLIARLLRAELIIDRKVLFRGRRRDGKGYAFFHWVPGQSIYPVHEALKRWAEKNPTDSKYGKWRGVVTPELVDRASHGLGMNLADKDYIQLDRAGEVCGAFTDDEISVHISNPSDEMDRLGFGESNLEMSLDVTSTILMAWNYNKEIFNTNYPDSILKVSGEYDKEGLEAFKLQLYGDCGKGGNQRLPVIGSGGTNGSDATALDIQAIKLREAPKDMLFDQLFRMLVAVKCASYGAHPSIINFQTDGGNGGASLNSHNPVDEIEFSKEHGFLPSLMDMCAWLTKSIIKETYPDLKLIIDGLDDASAKEKQDIFLNEIKTYKTKNEARMASGSEADGFYLTQEELQAKGPDSPDYQKHYQNPMNYPADAPMQKSRSEVKYLNISIS
jgi:hypothetical protein